MMKRLIYSEVDMSKVPGMLVGIIDKDSTYLLGYEETASGNKLKPNGETIWEIGSVTKVLTASLLSILVNDGTLSYEDPVDKYLPGMSLERNEKKITLENLVSHTAGLPKLPYNFGQKESDFKDPYANYTENDLLEFLKKFDFNLVEEEYQYSHVGYALLAVVMEKATGQSFNSLLQEKLLTPLDMKDTKIQLSEEDRKRMAQGYSLIGKPITPWNFQVFGSAIGYKSTANDLLKLLAVCLGDSHLDYGKIMEATLQEQAVTKIARVKMARGWHIFNPRKNYHNVYAHSGVTDGFRVYIGFVKENHTAVVVMSNSEVTTNGIGSVILQSINKNWR